MVRYPRRIHLTLISKRKCDAVILCNSQKAFAPTPQPMPGKWQRRFGAFVRQTLPIRENEFSPISEEYNEHDFDWAVLKMRCRFGGSWLKTGVLIELDGTFIAPAPIG
jgi:hypothetical protein